MGLLDDAIREHLDLKRRRGADPSEIAKDEAEALGPVRREEPEEPLDGPDHAVQGSYADDEPAVVRDEPELEYDDGTFADEAPVARDPDRPVPAEAPQTHADAYVEQEDESATPPHGDPLAHQPTREFSATELGDALGRQGAPAPPRVDERADADVVPADDEDSEDDDVLEETPDFLQETPEHDRLWFEQKPPKDFDF